MLWIWRIHALVLGREDSRTLRSPWAFPGSLGEHVVPSADSYWYEEWSMTFLWKSPPWLSCHHSVPLTEAWDAIFGLTHTCTHSASSTHKPGVCVTSLPGDRTHYTIQTSVPEHPGRWTPNSTSICQFLSLPLLCCSLSIPPHPQGSHLFLSSFLEIEFKFPTSPLITNCMKLSNFPKLFMIPFGKCI